MAMGDPIPMPPTFQPSGGSQSPFQPPEPQPYQGPSWHPSQRPPFEPPGFVGPFAGATVNPWQTGNELFRSEMGVDFLRTNDPLRGFKW